MQFQRPYFISQSIVDVAKKNWLRAIIYDSTRNRDGENLKFFNKNEISDYFVQHKTIHHESSLPQ